MVMSAGPGTSLYALMISSPLAIAAHDVVLRESEYLLRGVIMSSNWASPG